MSDSASTLARTAARRRQKHRRRLVFLAFVVTSTAAAVWWFWPLGTAADAGAAPATATVVRRNFASSVLATGAVQPRIGAEVRVGARISGKVERLLANIGDKVAKGQVVAELEKADLEAVVAQRQAELSLAEAKLAAVESLMPQEIEKARLDWEESQATHTLAEKTVGRTRKLRVHDAASEEALDQAQERHAVAGSRMAAASKALELAETRLLRGSSAGKGGGPARPVRLDQRPGAAFLCHDHGPDSRRDRLGLHGRGRDRGRRDAGAYVRHHHRPGAVAGRRLRG